MNSLRGDQSEKVFVIDDDAAVRKGLSNLLRSAGYTTESFASGQEFLDRAGNESGCVILDLNMPDAGGLEIQEILASRGYHYPIIFLTGYGDVRSSVAALKKGAVEFLQKPIDDELLLAAVEEALNKDRENRRQLNRLADIENRLSSLTVREFEVLRHVIAGSLNKQIAYTLDISEKTVKVHRARVMEKMLVNSVAELVRTTEAAGVKPIDSDTPKV